MNDKKFLDENGLLYLKTILDGMFNGKVDKVEGKGLSTNDLTNELLEKINNAGDSSFSGNYNDLTNKPTKLSQFTNDTGFQTESQVNTLINSKVTSVMRYKGSVTNYTDLPTNAEVGDTYNITNASTNNKAGDNAVWNGTTWDVLSGTIDLSNYWSKTELRAITNEEIEALFTEV